jgi:uncharacterized protein (DUF2062 family)
MKTRLRELFFKLFKKGECPRRLSLSFCAGIFIALSPFMGLHTVMTFIIAWLFGLNLGVTFLVAHCNNFFTVGPLVVAEYSFGQWLMQTFGVGASLQNPGWVCNINSKLTHFCGVPDISFWAFFIGASALAVGLSVGLYPIVRWLTFRFSESSRA